MADEEKTEDGGSGGGGGKKTMIVVLVALVLEAGAFFGAQMFMGGPAAVEGADVETDEVKALNTPVELEVHSGKHINRKTGRAKSVDVSIWVTVKSKHSEKADEQLKSKKNKIYDEIRKIIGRAEISHLNSGPLTTLRRQFKEVVQDVLGVDEEGEELTIEILISKFQIFNADL